MTEKTMTFVGPVYPVYHVTKRPTGYAFDVVQSGGEKLHLTFETKTVAKEQRQNMLGPNDSYAVPSQRLLKAIEDCLPEPPKSGETRTFPILPENVQ